MRTRPVRRILVAVKDPGAPASPALAKAAQLARAFGAELQLFHALTMTLYADVYGVSDKSVGQIERETRSRALDRLEAIAARLRREGLKVTTGAEWDFPAYESILRQARRGEADLIVAEPHAGHRIAPLLLHHTDWELLRLSPVPVLLVKTSKPYRKPVILAAVDPSHAFAKPSNLDARILRMATSVSTALGGVLHAVHAYVPLPIGVLELDAQTAQRLEADSAAAAGLRFERALRTAMIPRTRQHLVLNSADEGIKDIAHETDSAIVVMGAVSRSGLKRLFIGNTAERTLDALECDVLVVKPERFASHVARKSRGSRRRVFGPMAPV
jgi:universal stress protein E